MSSKLARAVLFFALGVVGGQSSPRPPAGRTCSWLSVIRATLPNTPPRAALENDSVAQIGAGGPRFPRIGRQ